MASDLAKQRSLRLAHLPGRLSSLPPTLASRLSVCEAGFFPCRALPVSSDGPWWRSCLMRRQHGPSPLPVMLLGNISCPVLPYRPRHPSRPGGRCGQRSASRTPYLFPLRATEARALLSSIASAGSALLSVITGSQLGGPSPPACLTGAATGMAQSGVNVAAPGWRLCSAHARDRVVPTSRGQRSARSAGDGAS